MFVLTAFFVVSLLLGIVIVFSACVVASDADRGTHRDELVACSTSPDGSAPRLARSRSIDADTTATTATPSPSAQQQHSLR
jgi:hypothetical protein